MLQRDEAETQVKVEFEEPFANPNFVIVAMTNHSAFYATLSEQTQESAVITISRLKESHVHYGFVMWIAIGNAH